MSVSIEGRYSAAIAYLHRAIDAVEHAAYLSSLVDWFAARNETEPAREELAEIEARWLRATNDVDRARVAREAELLADRTQESLPGAPQDRQRTNLWKGELPTSTPAISYERELEQQAHDAWDWTKNTIRKTANDAASIGTWLIVGGGALLMLKMFNSAKRGQRQADATRRALNRGLARVAFEHDAELT